MKSLSLLEASQPSADADAVSEIKSKLEAASYSLNEMHLAKAELENEVKTSKAKVLEV